MGYTSRWLTSAWLGDDHYVRPIGRLTGPLNLAALEKALNEILRRQGALRTTFAEVDGRPIQVVAPYTPQQLPLTDLSHLPAEEQEEEVRRYTLSRSRRPVDLTKGPLAHVELLKLSDQEHVVLAGIHQEAQPFRGFRLLR